MSDDLDDCSAKDSTIYPATFYRLRIKPELGRIVSRLTNQISLEYSDVYASFG